MEPHIALLAVVTGYLVGSFSFARLVIQLFAPRVDITRTEIALPGAEETVLFQSVSATTVSLHTSSRYGCLTSVLDMIKVAVPTLVFRICCPEAPYALIAASTAMVGHVWPAYYRFRGARGLSAAYGGLLAIDWLGIPATSLAGMVFGPLIFRDTLVIATVSLWFVVPWLWLRTRNGWYLGYGLFVNAIYLIAMAPEIKQYVAIRRAGKGDELARAMQSSVGKDIIRVAQRLGLLRQWRPRDAQEG
jgi:glycerol-3-phosphate acyltransferase PlsY